MFPLYECVERHQDICFPVPWCMKICLVGNTRTENISKASLVTLGIPTEVKVNDERLAFVWRMEKKW